MKVKNKILTIIILLIVFIILGTLKSNAGSLHLNNLDFDVQINSDGSMNVTETWNIDISSTNTLYKTFKTDSSKYSEIRNVSVKEITNGTTQNFTKTNQWSYHVQKGYYYGTKNDDGDFEIGWGVGLDNSSATKQYQISYKVKDAITKYNDYAELYWQFVGEDFEVSSDKITGTIYLPSNASSIDDIKVWGHTEDLNGTIYATDTNKIEFELNNFRSGRYVEIRTLFPTQLVTSSGRTNDTEILQKAINEETKWANAANQRRERQEWLDNNMPRILEIGFFIINIFFIIFFGRKIIKYSHKLKSLVKLEPTQKLDYFRELPNENTTPGEAAKIINMKMMGFTPYNFGNIFSATILDLALKGYLEIEESKNKKGKEEVNIKIKTKESESLKPEQLDVLNFIKKASSGKELITLKDLQNYIKNHSTSTQLLLSGTYSNIEKQLVKENKIDESAKKEYKKYKNYQTYYTLFVIFVLCFTLFIFAIPIILSIINAIMCYRICNKLNVLTQIGVDEKEEWNGLKKYMEDFSLLNEREVPDLIIWEKYLVYATAFGIADKVIKQLKMVYPNFDELTSGITTYSYMHLMMTTNFASSFSRSMTTSMSSAYSSGTGGGGGFSGGGGFGRRPEVAADGR